MVIGRRETKSRAVLLSIKVAVIALPFTVKRIFMAFVGWGDVSLGRSGAVLPVVPRSAP